MHLGEKIKKVRQLRSLTQESLGRKINLTRSAISFIEQNGKVNHQTLLNILKALSISEEDLVNFDHKAVLLREPVSTNNNYKTENESLKSKVESLTKEINTLKALVKSQQKLIGVLERKKN
jgi:transcriptional regulator with XRE-family HTH domain